MATIKINQQLERIEINQFEIKNQVVFNYFNAIPAEERGDKFLQAIYIGVLAMMEDRFASFLAKTTNELGTELESLKMIFEMKKEVFYKSSVKGILAENEIAEYLIGYFSEKKINDTVHLTGNIAGVIPRNKTGDIVCEVNGAENIKIVLECKFDKSIRLGDIESKDVFARKSDTAWSQLLESKVNRNGEVSIIVFDISLVDNSILKKFENVGFIPEVGFISIIDSQRGNYSNLIIAYMLARDIVLNAKSVTFDKQILMMIVNRIIKDIADIRSIKNSVENIIDSSKSIIKQLEKSMLTMNFNQEYLVKFLREGTLSKEDLWAFYQAEPIKDKYKIIEADIETEYSL